MGHFILCGQQFNRESGDHRMENFQFHVGTKILFGKGQLDKLPEILEPFGKKVLLTYGGGSIKRMGLYDKIKSLLADFEVFELGGIDPNPRVESVEAGAKMCRENNIDVILAVGGGSTIDCSKAIAAATFYDGSAWEMVKKASVSRGDSSVIAKAVPICSVLTLSATGSEMNSGGVISNLQTREKIGFSNPLLLPKCSILDPENTYTVPANQTAAGAADIMSHVLEVYFNRTPTFIPDRICEGLLKTVIQYAPVAIKEPENYEARANLMWASSLALNGLCGMGRVGQAWTIHPIEHELSAYYDITHGVGLAILTPRWMRYVLNDATVGKFAEYGVNVWGIDPSLDRFEIANKAIDATEEFFRSLGIPMILTELGIGEEFFDAMAAHALPIGSLQYAYAPLNQQDVVAILKMCL
jgi:alcohol dehydrogenase YqhD (iron-dependent ADH family)